jgi:hypothetical protein
VYPFSEVAPPVPEILDPPCRGLFPPFFKKKKKMQMTPEWGSDNGFNLIDHMGTLQ